MRDSVSKAFKSFSTKFEGYLTFMYGDVKNLVTTGMGNLIDPIGAALSLPWVNTDGSAATQQQITDAWNAVKARTDLNQKGGASYQSVTTIRLTDAGIDQLIQSRLQSNESTLRSRYPGYDNWPADAQLGIHSMAWAMGPAFNFPKFKADVNADPPDFTTAATDCQMSATGNPGLVPRNTANNKLFLNAAAVLKNKADPDQLYYPGDVPAGPATTTTAHPATTTTKHPASTTTAHPAGTTTAAPAAPAPTTTVAPAAPAPTTTVAPAAPAPTTTVAPAPTTTAPAASAPTTTTVAPAAPAATSTAAPAASTTAAPAASTTAAPAASTTAAPAASTTAAPAASTTAAPAASTTAATAASTTAAPGASTTAAPGASTTAAPGGTTTAPGTTTTAAPGTPAFTKDSVKVTIDPDDGTVQNPSSYQVVEGSVLTLAWATENATKVHIDPLGDQAASGSATIPTEDATYTLTALGDDGASSQPMTIEVHTHPEGSVVSAHTDVNSGISKILSLTATSDDASVTSVTAGAAFKIVLVCTDGTDTATINGTAVTLAAGNDGEKTGSLDVASADPNVTSFECEVSAGGAVADQQTVQVAVMPASTTAPPTTTTAAATTTTAPPTTTTSAPTTTTAAPTTTTTAAPTTTTTAPPTTTTAQDATGDGTGGGTGEGTSDATGEGTADATGEGTNDGTGDATGDATGAGTNDGTGDHTGAGTSDAELMNAMWSAADGSGGGSSDGTGEFVYTHGATVQLSVDASGSAEGRTVYFEIEHSENGTDWTWVKEVTAAIQNGKASASTELPDLDASGDGSGEGSGEGSGAGGGSGSGQGNDGAFDYCHYRFHASFTAGHGTGDGGGSGGGSGS